MRAVVLLSLAALSACASSTPGTARPETESVRIGGAERNNMRMTSITQTNVTPINFPIGKAWHAMPAAFDALSIPITTVDTARHTMSNDGFKLRRQLGSTPLSRYIDCGTTQIGENADSYEVFITVVAQLEEDEKTGLTAMHTTFEAMARPIAFSREYSRCSSKGVLEKRLADAVTAQLQ